MTRAEADAILLWVLNPDPAAVPPWDKDKSTSDRLDSLETRVGELEARVLDLEEP